LTQLTQLLQQLTHHDAFDEHSAAAVCCINFESTCVNMTRLTSTMMLHTITSAIGQP
jgi:hypothetical protein